MDENLRKIDHIVVLMMGNRSFDHMLGYLKLEAGRADVDGLKADMANTYKGKRYRVRHLERTELTRLEEPCVSGGCTAEQMNYGMDGFVANFAETQPRAPQRDVVMGYYNASDLPVYDLLAREFCVCDRWFCSVPGSAWANRNYALTGRTARTKPRRDTPICDLPSFARQLDKAQVSWCWYTHDDAPTLRMTDGNYLTGHFDNFAYFERVSPLQPKNFLDQAAAGALPAVSWIDPSFIDFSFMGHAGSNSDHPPSDVMDGQELVLKLYHALVTSPIWPKTLFVVTYDAHGGFYDHVVPPAAQDDRPAFRTYGVRVPSIVISPFTERGSVSNVLYDHTSIIKTILQRFCVKNGKIPDMGARVNHANHLGATITLNQARPPPLLTYRDAVNRLASRRAEVFSKKMKTARDFAEAPELSEVQRRVLAAQRHLEKPITEPTVAGISEKIGPIQAGAVPTLLPIVGIKPFDLRNEVFQEFSGIVPQKDPAELGLRPVSLVVAVDGNRWEAAPTDVLDSLQCTITMREGADTDLKVHRLEGRMNGLARIGHAFAEAPGSSFQISIQSPHIGSLRIAAAALPRRATVVTLALRPDGSFDLSQNILRLPGLPYDEPVPAVPYERIVRDLQLGQKLYQSGELATHRDNSGELKELFDARWTDPILSCMAYFSWIDAKRGRSKSRLPGTVADNLMKYFGELTDSRVVHGLARRKSRDQLYGELLASGEVPVLARSARTLAASAPGREYPDSPVVAASRHGEPGQAWLINWDVSTRGIVAPGGAPREEASH